RARSKAGVAPTDLRKPRRPAQLAFAQCGSRACRPADPPHPPRRRRQAAQGFTSARWDLVAEAPSSSLTVSCTSYFPRSAYECVGFCSPDVAPSPKLHCQLTITPSSSLLLSSNEQVEWSQCTSNSARGGWLASGALGSAECVLLSAAPSSSVTTSRTS